MLTSTQLAKLARIKNYSTRYELIVENDGIRHLVVYTPRRNRQGLISAIECSVAHGLSALTGVDSITFSKRGDEPSAIVGKWRIRFSGRTQRDAIIQGELPWVGDLAPVRKACHEDANHN
jgi:hypothetical protein